jgi:hypothetical protein
MPAPFNLIISNVPGPPIPLYFCGGRLVDLYPLGPIMDGLGLNLTVLSNMDHMGFGFIACRELMPDLWDLADAVPDALAELGKALNGAVVESSSANRPATQSSARSTPKKATAKKAVTKKTSARKATTRKATARKATKTGSSGRRRS